MLTTLPPASCPTPVSKSRTTPFNLCTRLACSWKSTRFGNAAPLPTKLEINSSLILPNLIANSVMLQAPLLMPPTTKPTTPARHHWHNCRSRYRHLPWLSGLLDAHCHQHCPDQRTGPCQCQMIMALLVSKKLTAQLGIALPCLYQPFRCLALLLVVQVQVDTLQ